MAAALSEAQNPYSILRLSDGPNASEADIRKAYKRLALVKHPDKNKNNPKADEEFAELRKALDVLLDKDARAALDDFIRARAAREERHAQQDAKRQKMREDLERREQEAAEKSQLDVAKARFMEELQRLRAKAQEQERQKMAAMAEAWAASQAAVDRDAGGDPELQEVLVRTLKVSWNPSDGEYSEQKLWGIFQLHGDVESVVMRKKKKQTASALVVMGSVASAQSAVHSVCGEVSAPLLVLPAKKASTSSPQPPIRPASFTLPWAAQSSGTQSGTDPAASQTHKSLFPGGAASQYSSYVPKPASMPQGRSFESFEAAILARCRQQGQEQREAQQVQEQRGRQQGKEQSERQQGQEERKGQQGQEQSKRQQGHEQSEGQHGQEQRERWQRHEQWDRAKQEQREKCKYQEQRGAQEGQEQREVYQGHELSSMHCRQQGTQNSKHGQQGQSNRHRNEGYDDVLGHG